MVLMLDGEQRTWYLWWIESREHGTYGGWRAGEYGTYVIWRAKNMVLMLDGEQRTWYLCWRDYLGFDMFKAFD